MIILKTCFKHSEDICRNKEALNLTSTICEPSLTLRKLQVGLWQSLPSSNNFLKRPSDEFLALEKLAKTSIFPTYAEVAGNLLFIVQERVNLNS